MDLLTELSPADYETVARLILRTPVYDWLRSGAGDGRLVEQNKAAFRRYRLRPRVMVDVSTVTISTDVLGTRLRVPAIIAPISAQRVIHPDGEIATAVGAKAAGSLMVLASNSTVSIEDVARSIEGDPWWFQIWPWVDRVKTSSLIERAEAAGCTAIVVTVNAPVPVEHSPSKIGFRLTPGLELAHYDAPLATDPSYGWPFVRWLADQTPLPIVVKGLLRADDAVAAADAGAKAIIVSNHGGRQLAAGVSPIEVVADIAKAVHGRAEVYVDGGVATGSDVLIALALGARAVLVGRPAMWGLAVGGAAGVERTLTHLADGLRTDAALCGVPDTFAIPPGTVAPA